MIYPQFFGSLSARLASSAVLVGVLVVMGPAPTQANVTENACGDGGGVTVVVDFTDLGGDIVTRCAPAGPDTGRAALEAAGFTLTDSQPGMICAIDAQPQPCPATFEGSYWAYWHSTPEGDWISYLVGADSSHPVAGDVEGWRYNDGTTPPGIAATDAVRMASPTTTTTAADGDDSAPARASGSSSNVVLFTALGLAATIAILLLIFRARARHRRPSGEI